MKLITAVVRLDRVHDIELALKAIPGLDPGMTLTEMILDSSRNRDAAQTLPLPQAKLEMVVADRLASDVMNAIREAADPTLLGNGDISEMRVQHAINIADGSRFNLDLA